MTNEPTIAQIFKPMKDAINGLDLPVSVRQDLFFTLQDYSEALVQYTYKDAQKVINQTLNKYLPA